MNLPAYLQSPVATLIDTEDSAVIFVLNTYQGSADKLVLRLNRQDLLAGKKEKVLINAIRTAGKVEIKRLTTDKRYKLVEGEL